LARDSPPRRVTIPKPSCPRHATIDPSGPPRYPPGAVRREECDHLRNIAKLPHMAKRSPFLTVVSQQRLRRGLAGVRQIVETVDENMHHTGGLSRARLHDLTGFQARLAAKMALHNLCLRCNAQVGRPSLARGLGRLVTWHYLTPSVALREYT
jgi:hypothetical protein